MVPLGAGKTSCKEECEKYCLFIAFVVERIENGGS
jgi:hypothetical protein